MNIKRLRIKAENIDKAAEIIAEFIAEQAAKGSPVLAPSKPVQASQACPAIDCTLADSNAPSVTLEAETLTAAEIAEIEAETQAEIAECEAKAEHIPLKLHGYRMLAAIHREELKAFNDRHIAEFEEYRTTGDKFIPWTMESENLAANAKAVHFQSPELWDEPMTKSRKRKRADQTAAATYRD